MKSLNANIRILIYLGLALVALFLVNLISGVKFSRIDLTDDQRYTMKPVTKQLLQDDEKFKENLHMKIYFTGELPLVWKRFHDELMLKLEQYKTLSNGKITFEFVDLAAQYNALAKQNPSTPAEKEKLKRTGEQLSSELRKLEDQGVKPKLIPDLKDVDENDDPNMVIIPGAILSYPGNGETPLSFVDQNITYSGLNDETIQNILDQAVLELEYNITSAIKTAITFRKPVVSFLQGHGELNEEETYFAKYHLGKLYDVNYIELTQVDSTGRARSVLGALDNTDLLIINKPKQKFLGKELYDIDQFILKGGKVIYAIDPINENRDSLYAGPGYTYGTAWPNDLNLFDPLFNYGVQLEKGLVLQNHRSYDRIPKVAPAHLPILARTEDDVEVRQYKILDWTFYPLVSDYADKRAVNGEMKKSKQHMITRGLPPVKLEYAGFIDPTKGKSQNLKKTVLLETSDSSTYRRPSVDIFTNIVNQKFDYRFSHIPVAMLVEGEFESFYKYKPNEYTKDPKSGFVKESVEPSRIMVISDGDIFKNDLDTISMKGVRTKIDLSKSVYANQIRGLANVYYGNKDFLLNSVEYMIGDYSLLSTKSVPLTHYLDTSKVEEDRSFWQMAIIVFPILFVAIFGFVYFLLRKKLYS